jgi:type II secretory pathway predicted ATPase ExeA
MEHTRGDDLQTLELFSSEETAGTKKGERLDLVEFGEPELRERNDEE